MWMLKQGEAGEVFSERSCKDRRRQDRRRKRGWSGLWLLVLMSSTRSSYTDMHIRTLFPARLSIPHNFGRSALARYLSLISKRASGELLTPASWMREFVQTHPDYKQGELHTCTTCHQTAIPTDLTITCSYKKHTRTHTHTRTPLSVHSLSLFFFFFFFFALQLHPDSVVSDSINYDLMKACQDLANGKLKAPKLLGDLFPLDEESWVEKKAMHSRVHVGFHI